MNNRKTAKDTYWCINLVNIRAFKDILSDQNLFVLMKYSCGPGDMSNFCQETRDKIISSIFKYPNMHIILLFKYIKHVHYSLRLLPTFCLQLF